jgi:hypothetical protein
MAGSGLALVLGEYWRCGGGDKKHCGANRFDLSHFPSSGLDNTFDCVPTNQRTARDEDGTC